MGGGGGGLLFLDDTAYGTIILAEFKSYIKLSATRDSRSRRHSYIIYL